MMHRHSRRKVLTAALSGALSGLLLHLGTRPIGDPAPPLALPDPPDLPDPIDRDPTPAPTFTPRGDVYVTAAEGPDADGSRQRPVALTRALSGAFAVGPGSRLLLLETAYQLDGPIALTLEQVQIGHIDGAPVTLRLTGPLNFTGGGLIWNDVTIIGGAAFPHEG